MKRFFLLVTFLISTSSAFSMTATTVCTSRVGRTQITIFDFFLGAELSEADFRVGRGRNGKSALYLMNPPRGYRGDFPYMFIAAHNGKSDFQDRLESIRLSVRESSSKKSRFEPNGNADAPRWGYSYRDSQDKVVYIKLHFSNSPELGLLFNCNVQQGEF